VRGTGEAPSRVGHRSTLSRRSGHGVSRATLNRNRGFASAPGFQDLGAGTGAYFEKKSFVEEVPRQMSHAYASSAAASLRATPRAGMRIRRGVNICVGSSRQPRRWFSEQSGRSSGHDCFTAANAQTPRKRARAWALRASSVDAGGAMSPSPLWLAARAVCEGGDVTRAMQLVDEAVAAGASTGGGGGVAAEAMSALDAVGRDEDGSVEGTPLWLACLAARNGVPGAVELAQGMVAAGADPNVGGAQGFAGDVTTPLWWAAAAVEAGAAGALDLAAALIAVGADVNAEGTYDVAGRRAEAPNP